MGSDLLQFSSEGSPQLLFFSNGTKRAVAKPREHPSDRFIVSTFCH